MELRKIFIELFNRRYKLLYRVAIVNIWNYKLRDVSIFVVKLAAPYSRLLYFAERPYKLVSGSNIPFSSRNHYTILRLICKARLNIFCILAQLSQNKVV